VFADAVVLAGGGHTRVFRRSSSRRDENTGDAMRLALEAGCRLRDMELVQFHPTGMVVPQEAAGTLVTEAVRGEGGILRNACGERFMERYDPERLALSSRDRAALANYTEIRKGRGTEHGAVLLDVSHLPRELVFERLPRMYRQFVDLAMVDMTRTPMEVAPTAHYSMGGVLVDELLAQRGEEFVRPLQRAVRDTMWEHCAVVRSDPGMARLVADGKVRWSGRKPRLPKPVALRGAGQTAAEYVAEGRR